MITAGYMLTARANNKSMSLPVPAFAGGTKAITRTPVVGTPRRAYAEMFIPGEEKLEDGEIASDGARKRQSVGDSRPGRGQHPRRSRQRRARPPGFRPRERRPRKLRESEAAGQQAQQGVPVSPARRPHGRHAHARRQLCEGGPGRRTDLLVGAQRDQASPGHAALRRSQSRRRWRGTRKPGAAPSTRTA